VEQIHNELNISLIGLRLEAVSLVKESYSNISAKKSIERGNTVNATLPDSPPLSLLFFCQLLVTDAPTIVKKSNFTVQSIEGKGSLSQEHEIQKPAFKDPEICMTGSTAAPGIVFQVPEQNQIMTETETETDSACVSLCRILSYCDMCRKSLRYLFVPDAHTARLVTLEHTISKFVSSFSPVRRKPKRH
jgi:hypothetical protein